MSLEHDGAESAAAAEMARARDRVPALLLGLGYLLVAASLAGQLVIGHALFTRSGALMVGFAIIAEFRLLQSRDIYHSTQLRRLSDGQQMEFEQVHPSNRHRALELVAHVSSVLGTVIWAYGDLVFP